MSPPSLGFIDLCRRGRRSASEALDDTLHLVQAADSAGYGRFWVAEHHVDGASHTSPEVLVALLSAQTERIRVGSGGVLLRYYSPFKVAETFLMLEALAPGRVDLGVARGPGVADVRVAEALVAGDFDRKVRELSRLLHSAGSPSSRLQPTGVAPPPLWILGSGPSSAALAACLRRPYAVALFFAGSERAADAMAAYRRAIGEERPATIVALSVTCADTRASAVRRDARLVESGKLPANFVGTPDGCVEQLARLAHGVDEVMVTTLAEDPQERHWLVEALGHAWAGAQLAGIGSPTSSTEATGRTAPATI